MGSSGSNDALGREFADAESRASQAGSFYDSGTPFMLRSLGSEGEGTVEEEGRVAPGLGRIAFAMLTAGEKNRVGAEFPRYGLEEKTLPVGRPWRWFGSDHWQKNFLPRYWRELWASRWVAHRVVENAGANFVQIGSTPFDQVHLNAVREWVTTDPPRFFHFVGSLAKRHGGYQVVLDYLNGETERMDIPCSPALAGNSFQDSLNVGYAPEMTGLAWDIHRGYLTPAGAICSNSAILGEFLGKWYNNRLSRIWVPGMSPDASLTPWGGPEGYCDIRGAECLVEYLRFIHDQAEDILSFEQAGKGLQGFKPWKNLRLRAGTCWIQTVRVQWSERRGKIVIWLEIRSVDAQPTLAEKLALDLLQTGNVLYHIKVRGIKSASELCTPEESKRNTTLILEHGPEAQIQLNGRTITAQRWFCDELIPQAIEGLISDRVCSRHFATSSLTILQRAVTRKTTGSFWIRKETERLMGLGKSEKQAVRQAYHNLGQVQLGQPTNINDFRGLGDLEPR